MNRTRNLFIVFSLLLISCLVASQFLMGRDAQEVETYDLLKIFSQAFTITNSQYVEDVKKEEIMKSAERGLVASLDGISYYLSASEIKGFNEFRSLKGTESGLKVVRSGTFFVVISVFPGSPGDEAGIEPGDLINAVNGRSVNTLNLWEIEAALSGAEGDAVTLTTVHGKDDETVKAELELKPYAVTPFQEESNFGFPVLTLTEFSSDTLKWLKERLTSLSEGELILDLRGSRGSDYQSAVDMAALLTEKGKPASLEGKKYGKESLQSKEKIVFNGRAAVLIDGTVSGPAELFTALIKEDERITIIGHSTAGLTGLQKFVPLGEGGLWITVATYRTGDISFHGKGVRPDEVISERIWIGKEEGEDPFLKKASEILTETRV